MKALLNREIKVIRSMFGSEFNFQSIIIILLPIIIGLVLNTSLFSLIFSACAILNIVNLIEEIKIREGILSMTCTRREYVKFRFLSYNIGTVITLLISAIISEIFCKISRIPNISLEYELIILLVVIIGLTINITIFFVASENVFGIVSLINIGTILSVNFLSSFNGHSLLDYLSLCANCKLTTNWICFLAIFIVSIIVIFISMIISIYFFEKRDL